MSGIEWVVDAQGCSAESLRDLKLLRSLFDKVIADLRLRPVGATQWHQFPGSGGITGLCLLSESHLACHTFPEYRSLCLNLFCCVPRSQWDFERHLAEMFCATSVEVRALERPYSPADAVKRDLALMTGGRSQ
jgi:S-adenosylmethionine decarboxylase